MEAAADALAHPNRPYLLHIDEINRPDLAKVPGDAISLLETEPEYERQIELPYDFGDPFGRRFRLPRNLHILGTTHSADRSIALVDIAIRRRLRFINPWKHPDVVERSGAAMALEAYRGLLDNSVEYASGEAFCLLPGHAYFMVQNDDHAAETLRLRLAPLLEEYLAQGYVSGFGEQTRAYLQWLKSLGEHTRSNARPELCPEAADYRVLRRPVVQIFGGRRGREAVAIATRLARQFLEQNPLHFTVLKTQGEIEFEGAEFVLRLVTGARASAIPLLSPLSVRHDLGRVIQPRFE